MWSKNKEIQAIKKMLDEGVLTRERLLLSLFTGGDGDLYLSSLDFSDFEGNVFISNMKVKRSLFQSDHKVEGNLFQSNQEVEGNYYSINTKVKGRISFEVPTKMLRKITLQELKAMGYELEE